MGNYWYLAHALVARKAIREWELGFEHRTGINLLNPFYDTDRPDVREMDEDKRGRYDVDPVTVVQGDVELICKGNGLIGVIDGSVGYGTPMEIVYAYKEDKEVILIVTNGDHQHPWLRYHASRIYTSFREFEANAHLYK